MSGILSNITSNVQISGDMIYNQKKKKTNPFIKKKKKKQFQRAQKTRLGIF